MLCHCTYISGGFLLIVSVSDDIGALNHCVQNSGAFLLLVSITDNIYIHRLLYAKSLSLNFGKFVVFVTVYARYIHSIFNFFMC